MIGHLCTEVVLVVHVVYRRNGERPSVVGQCHRAQTVRSAQLVQVKEQQQFVGHGAQGQEEDDSRQHKEKAQGVSGLSNGRITVSSSVRKKAAQAQEGRFRLKNNRFLQTLLVPPPQHCRGGLQNTHRGEFRSSVMSQCLYQSLKAVGLQHHYHRKSSEPRIWVCVRKRPLTPAEEWRQETDVVTSSGESCVVHESRAAVDLTQYELKHRFYFDHVFGESCSNEEVYLKTAFPLVQHMLQGGSATCFAYGQTGAGKTHTMLGSGVSGAGPVRSGRSRPLLSPLSFPALAHLTVFVSFFEIYCGQLYDLLDNRKRLFAREDGQRNVHIAGLCHRRVDSVHSLLQMISRGTDERSQGSSGVNPVSSRSHALLQIQLREADQTVHGRMWFVDLAGSERASDSRDPDRRSRMEGAEINQSLLALKECIRSLDQEQGHTPFRQSKLTQVLKDSFIGDSLTCMIANISPGLSSTEHTLNTLRYADRVKELKGQTGQRRGRRVKNISSPKQNLSQGCRRHSGGRYRDSSPLKKPRTNSTVPSSPMGMQAEEHATFLNSTPKNLKQDDERKSRKMFEWISPVKSQPTREHEDGGREFAPAERPLSPAAEHRNSLLTLSDLTSSKMTPENEEMDRRDECSVNVDTLRVSMLEEDHEPASGLFLQPKPNTSEVKRSNGMQRGVGARRGC
ncbi:hypothetical protein WMY93_004727 [Mugilogobius chulae]|uniref:Kinesin-like protein n=1 Tax=Mugilogobius chulae TaxID=88201 RepID=A0AAW0PZ72_9GOBI